MVRWFCDGSGWNGKKSAYCVVNEETNQSIIEVSPEEKTNNEMEYIAVLKAMELASQGDVILTDSLLIVNQVCKKWKMNVLSTRCGQLRARIADLMAQKQLTLEWIAREQNLAGQRIEKNRKNKLMHISFAEAYKNSKK